MVESLLQGILQASGFPLCDKARVFLQYHVQGKLIKEIQLNLCNMFSILIFNELYLFA